MRHAISIFPFAGLLIDHRLQAPYGGRRTLQTYESARRRSKYSGAQLREIRRSGQKRECARRLRKLAAS